MDTLLSAVQLAEYLNLKPVTIRRKAKEGEIPSIRVGNRLRFDKEEIYRWQKQTFDSRPARILVVDDDPEIGRFFEDCLCEHGYQVKATLSSFEALELVGNEHFDLVFLDMLMPILDGAELFRRIRHTDRDIPVAIITGYPDSDVLTRAMEHGPFTVMKKPFSESDITSVVNSFLQAARLRK